MKKTIAREIQDNKNKFATIFNLPANEFMDSILTVTTKKFNLDIVKLDDWMVKNKGYDIDKDGSLSDFIGKSYGDEAVKFIEESI